ncbi:MAG: 3-methyl-2-oxobutanoate hydroxymethyltransferase [Candidatus Omnitrophica bacterium]|nr:3-methyl-2-oxobutanoate hydroxymethyltransferase [Candidatus Omnitrophota bacterium]MBU4478931.1 3-methyl-2-oxobutanoate hydroxymethyltransferase [Candidatus Omnitrophota bacterium]MCG2704389.1 3-methyl-2-oxobutanoate hydroxymethyltransferase [Candidatus Omnitrophota bacterium]
MERKKITISDLSRIKSEGGRIAMLTAYDFSTALVLESAGIDIILVGDSLGNVILGYDSTVPVTMEEMIHHAKAVRRGTRYAFLVADMPFMSFNIDKAQTITNAGRLVKEAGADAVKIEGGNETISAMIKAVVDAGIPVMGHIGLTPQTATMLGGYKVQGNNAAAAKELMRQAAVLEKAGCFSIVLECIPDVLAELISKKMKIPVIGIGAGVRCDGQVLVTHDMLGLYERLSPKFVKRYAHLAKEMSEAVANYIQEVKDAKFPLPQHSYTMKKEELEKLGL